MNGESIVLYREWLPLDKKEFRILAMLADKGEFTGNLSDMCRYFSLTPQTRNRNQLRESIQKLSQLGFIEHKISGNTYTLRAIPKAEKIPVYRRWADPIMAHNYSSEPVAWEQVIKVFAWIVGNKAPVVTNDEIAADINISVSTIGSAKNVLEHEFSAILRDIEKEKRIDSSFRNVGQRLTAKIYWSDE